MPGESEVKHTVYLPADFVRQLQQGAIGERRSSYGAVQSFLRQAMADWIRKRAIPGAAVPALPVVLIEAPVEDARFYERLIRYMTHVGTPSEQAWKQALRHVVAAWREDRGK